MASDLGDPTPVFEAKLRTREIFDDCGEHYATEREHTPYFKSQLAIMQRMFAKERVGRVLDIGCAAGGEISPFRKRGFSVVGIDFSQRMLEFGSLRFAADAQVSFCRADAERLPFTSQSMDHIVCLGVFEFLPGYEAAVREIHRVMRPGGLAVFAIPSKVSLYNIGDQLTSVTIGPLWRGVKRLLGRMPSPGPPPGARNLVVPWKYRALLRDLGFEPERSAYTNFFLYPLDRFPKWNERVAAVLEPAASIPLIRWGASVYLVSARRK